MYTSLCMYVFLQLDVSIERLPDMQALLRNFTARLEPYHHLLNMGLYTDLSLQKLAQRIGALEVDVTSIHGQQGTTKTQKLVKEVLDSSAHNVICSLNGVL